VTWTFVLNDLAPGVTRLIVRVRGGAGYRFYGLPLWLTKIAVRIVHYVMQRKQLLGIARRAEGQAASRRAETRELSTNRTAIGVSG
jgi:heme exporter protein D